MDILGFVEVQIRGNLNPLAQSFQAAQGMSQRFDQSASAGLDRVSGSAMRASNIMNILTSQLARIAGLVAGAFSVHALISMTSQWTDLNSRVRIAVRSEEAAIEVMERLERMARRTYSSLQQTAESFILNSTSLRELGYTTNEQLDFTEALNNALVVSGAKADRAASVMNALSKAMALGQLRGEYLNTVVAMGGRVAEVLAEHLGVTTNQLRTLGREGKITGDIIFEAMISNLDTLREEADSMPATIQDAFLLMGNSLLGFVGRVDEAIGMSNSLAQGLISIADAMTAATQPTIALFTTLGEHMPAILSGLGAYIALAHGATLGTIALTAALAGLRTAVAFVFGPVGLLVGAAMLIGEVVGQMKSQEQAVNDASAATRDNAAAIAEATSNNQEYSDALREKIELDLLAAETALLEARQRLVASEAQEEAVSSGERNLELLIYQFQNFIPVLLGAGTNAERAAAQVDELTAAVAALRAQLAGVTDRFGVFDDLGDTFSSPEAMFNALRRNGTRPPPPRVLGTEQKNEYERMTEQLNERIRKMEDEAATFGMVTEAATRYITKMDLLNAAQEAGIPITDELTASVEALAEKYAATEAAAEALKERQNELQDIYDFSRNTFVDFFTSWGNAIRATGSVFEALKQTALNTLSSIASELTRLAAMRIFWALFGRGPGLGGGLFSGLFGGAGPMDIGAGVLHAGGYAGSGPTRMVAAGVFAGARRYHNGGLVGDEVPAILQRGERVIPKGQSANDRLAISVKMIVENGQLRAEMVQVAGQVAGRVVEQRIKPAIEALAPSAVARASRNRSRTLGASGG